MPRSGPSKKFKACNQNLTQSNGPLPGLHLSREFGLIDKKDKLSFLNG